LVLSAPQNLEDQLIPLFAVLAHQRFDVFERGGFERYEPISLISAADDIEDVLTPADVVGQEIARSSSGLGATGSQGGTKRSGRRTSGLSGPQHRSAAV